MKLLLIHSPLDDPTVPYHSTAYLKGHLAANGFHEVTMRDVNIEYVNWLLWPSTAASINEYAARTLDSFKRSSLNFAAQEQYIGLLGNGVTAAGAITNLPIGDGGTTGDFVIEGRPNPAHGKEVFARKEIVTPGYFQAMKIPLIAGRFFTDHDRAKGRKVVIISQAMAKQFWLGKQPIGQRLNLGLGKQDEWQEIIGIVGDVKADGLGLPAAIAGYLSAAQYPSSAMAVVARTAIDPLGLAPAARSVVSSIDSQQPVSDLAVMDQILSQSVSEPRSLTYLLSAFAGVALLLASFGVYGVVAWSMALRTREIGIRIALGAKSGEVLLSILVSGMKLLAIGLPIGLACAAGLLQVFRNAFFGISAVDSLTFLFGWSDSCPEFPLCLFASGPSGCFYR